MFIRGYLYPKLSFFNDLFYLYISVISVPSVANVFLVAAMPRCVLCGKKFLKNILGGGDEIQSCNQKNRDPDGRR